MDRNRARATGVAVLGRIGRRLRRHMLSAGTASAIRPIEGDGYNARVGSIDRYSAELTGWGRASRSVCEVVEADPDRLRDVIAETGPRGAVARGCGRSYGDPALNSGGEVIRIRSAPTPADNPAILLEEHPNGAAVTANAGVTIAQLLDYLVPRGYFVPVTPGTRTVTLGGAVASDIHGKNHHLDGSFGSHVSSMDLMLADGSTRTITPNDHPELFWATIGGMGLTGIVVAVTFAVLPIETSRIVVDSRRIGNLDALMSAMEQSDQNYRYSVAWIDVLARGRQLGRGVLTDGFHAGHADLDRAQRRDPLAYDGTQRATFPRAVPPGGCINRATVAAFNEAWFRKVPATTARTVESIPGYFHPLDAVGSWNLAYGRAGFVQYQLAVPHSAGDVIGRVVESMSNARLPSFLSVLKRFGPQNPGYLSFPIEGWTLAVDVSTRVDNLGRVLAELDDLVIGAGGRHYLAKDHLLGPDQIRASYPRLGDWQRVQAQHDPSGRWKSDQSRRLQLTAATTRPGSASSVGIAVSTEKSSA